MAEAVKAVPDYKKLLDGNARFRQTNQDYRALARGQNPEHIVVACSDSRVAPELITGAKLGEVFTIRAIGGVIGESTLASIEYGVEHLGVRSLVFVAHTNCGAVTGGQEILNASIAGKFQEGVGSPLNQTLVEIYKNIAGNTDVNSVDLTHAAVDNAVAEARKTVEKSDIAKRALAEGALAIGIALYDMQEGSFAMVKTAEYDRNTGTLGFVDVARA